MIQQDSLVEYGARRVIVTLTAILCTVLQIVDSTIVNVALNDMKGNLGATTSEIGWVITSYAVGNVIVIPMTSWLAQQFGRRNYFAVSIALFTICSFLCGNSTTITELIVFRFLQGVGGGALMVTSQTIITESYPFEKRSMAQAIYGMGVIVGPTLGPPLGGYITDHYQWPYIFYINIPLGIIAILLTLQFVRSPKYAEKSKRKDIDWLGIGLLMIFVGALQYVLEKGEDDDWFNDKLIVILTVTSILGFFFFIWREVRFRNPVVHLRVLNNGNLRIGTILAFILGFGLYGSTFIIPLYTQAVLGWTATQSGVLLIPSAITTAICMPFVGQLLQKGVKQQYIAATGMFLFFLYSVWGYKIITPDTSEEAFFWILILRGVAMGLLFVPITTLALSTLQGKQIGEGVAFIGMTRQLGGSFGIAVITTYMARRSMLHRNDLVSKLDVTNPVVQNKISALQHGFIAKGDAPNTALQMAHKVLDYSVMKQAAVMTYMDVFMFIGILFLICVPFVLIARGTKVKDVQMAGEF